MKKYIFLAVLLIIGGGAYYIATSYEGIVKRLVNKYGSAVTGTDVSMQGFKISLKDGTAQINKITVANPKGYKKENFVSLEGITVKLNIKSLTSDTIIIENITVDKPVINYEMVSLTKNNISEIQKNVSNYTSSGKPAKPQEEKKAEKTSGSSKKVVIKELHINKGELSATANVAGKDNSVNVVLPDISMHGIGEGKSGDSIPVVISKILTQIIQTATQTVAKANLADFKGVAEENLNNVVGGVKDRVKSIGIFK